MLFINNQDYEIIYEYLKFIPYNPNIDTCSTVINLLFSVIVALINNNNLSSEAVSEFCTYVLKEKRRHENKSITNEEKRQFENCKKHKYFSKTTPLYNRNEYMNPKKDHEKWLLKHKVYESLLSNKNKELLESS